VDRLQVTEGNTVELDKVLLIADDDRVTVGTPTVDGAKVVATSQGEGKGKKIIVFKYKPKVRYRKKTGAAPRTVGIVNQSGSVSRDMLEIVSMPGPYWFGNEAHAFIRAAMWAWAGTTLFLL